MNSVTLGIKTLAGFGTTRAIRILGTALGVFLLCPTLFAQTNTGRILGNVHDETDAIIAGATVTITDMQRGVTRTLTTDQAGGYVAPNLLPGVYLVRATSTGFKNVERPNIELEVAKDIRINFVLPLGEVSSTVTVTEEAPMVDSTSAVLGGTLNNQTINDLPLQGRNFQGLLQLRPGVLISPGGGKWSQTTNGLRPEYNVYIINGIDAIESFSAQSVVNGAGIVGDSSSLLPIDSIQEFNTQENPKAEYGWKPGAVVNVGLKSGTNQLHGTGFAFGRDSALDARNPFTGPGLSKQIVALEQFGASVGGPIRRDRIFFFGAYEGQRALIGTQSTQQLPTTAPLANPALSLMDACNALPAANRNPLSLRMAGMNTNCQVTDPKSNLFQSGSSSRFITTGANDTHQDNFLVKMDYHLNERHNLSGEYFFSNFAGLGAQGSVKDYWRTNIYTRSQLTGIHWTWIASPRLLNEARFGFNRVYQPSIPGDCQNIGQPDTSYLHTGAQQCGFPYLTIAGFASLGCCVNFPKIQGPDYTYQFLDDVSYTRGKHALKFGGELRRMIFNGGTFRAGRGFFNFTSTGNTPALQNFIAGLPFQGRIFIGNPIVHVTYWAYAGFLQDDWRITPRLTLNLGLRYEYNTPIKETHNQLANFDPNLGIVQVGKQISTPYEGDRNNFSPRVGFAWDVTGNGRTVVRGGGAVIYQLLSLNVILSQQGSTAVTTGLNTTASGALLNGAPGPGNITVGALTLTGAQLNWSLAGPIFPTGQIACTTAQPCPILAVDQHLRTPYVGSWNLGLQHAFTPNLSLDVAYVGNHAAKLTGMVDINAAVPGSGWTGTPAPASPSAANENSSRPFFGKFPYLSNINAIENAYLSNYNALQATLTERPHQGLSFTAGYTYSHSLDEISRDWNANVPMSSLKPKLDYGSSEFDIRHRFTLSMTYALPEKKSFGQLLQGWQINSILVQQSAQPWNVVDSAHDSSGTGEFMDRWNFFGDPAEFSGRRSVPIPWFPGTGPSANPACVSKAASMGAGAVAALQKWGCFVAGNSMMIPPPLGTLGTMGRNIFRATGLKLWDLSLTKKWTFAERLTAQFRAEVFNVLNKTQFATPNQALGNAAQGGTGNPAVTTAFGSASVTPDVAVSNPQIGSGAARSIQLGLKLIF